MSDLISRQATIEALWKALYEYEDKTEKQFIESEELDVADWIQHRIFVQNMSDIDRQTIRDLPSDAIDEKSDEIYKTKQKGATYPHNDFFQGMAYAEDVVKRLPSAQPEQHTCVNCGRTINNGGWYADGGTRCPIEEHYALPKDGYCHLWEKRNVTDDDYPERREE